MLNKDIVVPTDGFLTEVCKRYFKEQYDENCYYLQALIWFRDHLMTDEDKEEYYRISPVIVAKINAMESSDEMYNILFTNVVQKCADLIEDDKSDEAYKAYKNCLYDVGSLAYQQVRKREFNQKNTRN